MAVSTAVRTSARPASLVFGLIAAVLATLIFHQLGVALCHLVGLTASTPYNLRPVPPFGVPAVLSLAFWGGVWGTAFVLAEKLIARSPGGYWAGAIIFGAAVPTVFSWLIVAPLKGAPIGYGFPFPGLFVGPIVNGLWGLGTGLFLTLLRGAGSRPG
jgi:hypothetical protein